MSSGRGRQAWRREWPGRRRAGHPSEASFAGFRAVVVVRRTASGDGGDGKFGPGAVDDVGVEDGADTDVPRVVSKRSSHAFDR
jgi:hypothetical protein